VEVMPAPAVIDLMFHFDVDDAIKVIVPPSASDVPVWVILVALPTVTVDPLIVAATGATV